jgi:hypothetical protein
MKIVNYLSVPGQAQLARSEPDFSAVVSQMRDRVASGVPSIAIAVAWHGTLAAMTLQLCRMPLTVFDIKGVPGNRRERIEAAVIAGGGHASGPHEAWIAADPFNGGYRGLITGPHGFERTVTFAIHDDPAVIAERVRETLEE